MYRLELKNLASPEKEKVMETTMSWAEKAEQRGIQQGMQQGMTTLLTHVIERRFGSIEPSLAERIRALNPDQLESLGDALFDFNEAEGRD